jgi:hypothetical protein
MQDGLGRAVQVDPMNLTLKAPESKCLKPELGGNGFKLCFQNQLAPLQLGTAALTHTLYDFLAFGFILVRPKP